MRAPEGPPSPQPSICPLGQAASAESWLLASTSLCAPRLPQETEFGTDWEELGRSSQAGLEGMGATGRQYPVLRHSSGVLGCSHHPYGS